MKSFKLTVLYITLIAIVILLEHFTDIDLALSNIFYDLNAHRWVISHEDHMRLKIIFYDGAKCFVSAIGTTCVIYMLISIKKKQWRRNFIAVLTVLLSTMSVPTVVSHLKTVTNVYCPNQLELYEGKYPYVKVLEDYPESFSQTKKGRCFPGGHVTGAFSLMSLYLVFRDRKNKYAALGFAMTFGFTSSIYQMMRGEHFISHNLISMLIAAVTIITINSILKRAFNYVSNIKITRQINLQGA